MLGGLPEGVGGAGHQTAKVRGLEISTPPSFSAQGEGVEINAQKCQKWKSWKPTMAT